LGQRRRGSKRGRSGCPRQLSDGEQGGGPGWHRGGEAGGGGRRGGVLYGGVLLLYPQEAVDDGRVVAGTVGGETAAMVKPWVREKRRRPRSKAWCTRLGASVQTVRLTSGPMWFHFFPIYPKLAKTCKIKMDALSCSKKIPIFCMTLDWNILNNVLNCADFKFPT
jgi:hypothetical protein